MSGIFGQFNFVKEKLIDPSLLSRMGKILNHRGPDGQEIYQHGNFGFGACRFNPPYGETIQPVSDESKLDLAILDGELYERSQWINFLKVRGYNLNNPSGVELLLPLYKEFGEGFIQKLRGEFAFALWNEREQKLILGRDQVGYKPLYYLLKKNGLTFASEVKAILQDPEYEKKLSLEGLNYFLTYSYVPWPDTLFQGIKQIPPGYLLICQPYKVEVKPYWEFTYRHLKRQPEQYYAHRLYELMEEAVRIRVEGLDSIGSFLSGGLDSSTLVGLLTKVSGKQVKTFSVGFEEQTHNELPDARITSTYFDTEHHEIIVTPRQVQEFLAQMIWHTDQPFFDSTAIATYYGAKLAKEHVNIVFDAHGPDQLLAGFPAYHEALVQKRKRAPFPEWFRAGILEKLAACINPDNSGNGLKGKLIRAAIPFEKRHRMERAIFNDSIKRELCAFDLNKLPDPYQFLDEFFAKVKDCDFLEKILYWEVLHMVHDDLMVKVDRMVMAASLEARIPFVDSKLMEFIGTIPSDLKLRELKEPILKYIFKKSLTDLLPSHTLSKKKQGFSMPMVYWLKNSLKDFVCEILLDPKTLNRGYFNKNYLRRMIEQYYKGNQSVPYTQIWGLLIFEMWNRIFMDGEQ